MYKITKNSKYDFSGESYAELFPQLHKYPATMLPQIGIEIFKELNIKNGKLLDPYCGSGSSFFPAFMGDFSEVFGCDINPLARLISKCKFTKVNIEHLKKYRDEIFNELNLFATNQFALDNIEIPSYKNIKYWFPPESLIKLSIIKKIIFSEIIVDADIKDLFLLAFSETLRECSYTRNNEFKLYRIKKEKIVDFNPNAFKVFISKLDKIINTYIKYYNPILKDNKLKLVFDDFIDKENYFDVVLTSPPYGDSKTTVAYGQFSLFSNEWLEISNARKIDNLLMGGTNYKKKYNKGIIADYIKRVESGSEQRAFEISSFYFDLEESINDVAKTIKIGGKSIYVVGNRCSQGVRLPTDQFIAEKFEENGFKHLFTYERILGNKTIPLQNISSNKKGIKGVKRDTMLFEYIVVCEKKQIIS